MPTPTELRQIARAYAQAVEFESSHILKIRLASHAFALAQLAEAMERAAADRSTESDWHRGRSVSA